MHHHHNRRRGVSPTVMLLIVNIASELNKLPVKPPVTIALLGMNIVAYVHPFSFLGYNLGNIQQNCLNPSVVWDYLTRRNEVLLNRLVLSGIIHADDMHLYYNMISLCWKGINLELSLGSMEFFHLIAFTWIVSHSLVVLIAYFLYETQIDPSKFNTCAVGFSAVLFALKYVLNHSSPANSIIYGISIPTKYAAWLEMLVVSVLFPNSSLLGHMCGILAGVLYCHVYIPLLQYQNASGLTGGRPTRHRTYGSGTLGTDSTRHSPASDLHSNSNTDHSADYLSSSDLRQRRLGRYTQPGGVAL